MPEWPNGTALKAVADRNASRGFESRSLCVTHYRLDRAFVMLSTGLCFITAAIAVVISFLTRELGTVGTVLAVVTGVIGALALALALIVNLRPPVVLTLDPIGYRTRGRGGDGSWKDVQDVAVAEGFLRFTDAAGQTAALPLQYVDHRRHQELVREVYDRLNTAHGYRRFEPFGD